MAARGARKRNITADSLLSLRTIRDVSVHPDGTMILFSVDECDFEKSKRVLHLFCAEFKRARARQISWTDSGEHSPQFSPDGKQAAFLSSRSSNLDEDEDDNFEQIWLLPDSGEAKRLTEMPEGVEGFQWFPDGKRLAYLAIEPKPAALKAMETRLEDIKRDSVTEDVDKQRRQIWAVEIETGDKELLYEGDYGVNNFEISYNGEMLAYTTTRSGEGRDEHKLEIWLIYLRNGERKKISQRLNLGWNIKFTPDDKALTFLGSLHEELGFSRHCLFRYNFKTSALENLTEKWDQHIEHYEWNKFDKCIYFTAGKGVHTPLYKMTPAPIAIELIAGEFGSVTEFMPGKKGIAYVMQSKTQPMELHGIRKNGKNVQITTFNEDFVKKHIFAEQKIISWESDNLTIEAVLVLPVNYEKGRLYPAIINVHGGPASRTQDVINSYTMQQLWASHGYVWLSANFRGSTGYGNAFAVSNVRDLGGGDFKDIMRGVDWLIEQGIADPDRLGVMGGSYGGYMTNWILTQSDRFKAGASLFGIFNLVTDYSNSNFPRWEHEYMGGYYWDDISLYLQRSPASYAAKIKTPILIAHGDEDDNTPLANSKEMYQVLRDRGVPVEFVRFPREGHGNGEPNHRLEESRRWLEWFDRYLMPEKSSPRRVGDVIKSNGWELRILSAEPLEFGSQRNENNPYMQVEFALFHREGMNKAPEYSLMLNEILLQDMSGRRYRPIGVPVSILDTTVIVEGKALKLRSYADKDSGVIAAPVSVLFDLPKKDSEYLLTVKDFQPVRIFVQSPTSKKKPTKTSSSDAPTIASDKPVIKKR